jgi:hypothetical protein
MLVQSTRKHWPKGTVARINVVQPSSALSMPSEVMILGEMYVCMIDSHVAVCMFCAVRYLIISCFSLLISNYSTYVL